jgi:hypothetical protein
LPGLGPIAPIACEQRIDGDRRIVGQGLIGYCRYDNGSERYAGKTIAETREHLPFASEKETCSDEGDALATRSSVRTLRVAAMAGKRDVDAPPAGDSRLCKCTAER